ncbi:MAG: tryptophan synthase subunit alpha [Sandaracinaceae bacterium]|nr:tryptophan synthase subunit alpha [Sandaracinaceae bacterium]
MSRLDAVFERERTALVIYLCAGDPSLEVTPDLIVAAAEAGADVVEVGMPFSDPTADGPTIQAASERALRGGATLPKVLDAVRAARARTDVPIVLFGYYNPILRYGEARLAADAAAAGVDGFLVVDLPPEHVAPLLGPLREHGLDFIPLLAPTSTAARVEAATSVAGAFIYYVSMTGVTGAAGAPLEAAAARAAELTAQTGKPVVVGFGVRSAEDVATVAAKARGVVVGSAVVRAIEASSEPVAAVRACVTELARGR